MDSAMDLHCANGRTYATALLLESPVPPRARAALSSLVDRVGGQGLRSLPASGLKTLRESLVAGRADGGTSADNRGRRAFAQGVVQVAARACAVQDEVLQAALYRLFDPLDEVLQLDFTGDLGMAFSQPTPEKIYAGSGRGVQTSYLTILEILNALNLGEHAHLIDLGAGFGRVGLIAGLWRADLRFTGFEIVGHRVQAAQQAARRHDLDARVCFVQQDLSSDGFEIPTADVYYLYDPFFAPTYGKVLARLNQVGRAARVTVVTKGDAGDHFAAQAQPGVWSVPESYDYGNLKVFRSAVTARRPRSAAVLRHSTGP